jgi:thioesterase domain-containing protein
MSTPQSPETNLEKELVRIWEQVLGRAPIGIQENFFELGGTSIQAAQVFTKIEEVFQQRLPLSLILAAPTIEKLAPELLPGKNRERMAHVYPVQPEGDKPIFFCVGSGVLWRPVAERLGADQPVYNIGLEPQAVEQLKGSNSIEKLARYMVAALLEKQPQGPYYLGGFCNDGIFAYEVARQLKLYGQEVGLLALVEARNPFPNFKRRIVNNLRRNAIQMAFQADQFRHLLKTRDVSQYVQARREQLRRFKLRVSSSVSPGFRKRARQTGQVDTFEALALETDLFKPKPLACSTVIFRCADFPTISAGDPYFGWREFLKGRSQTYELPGDHMGMWREPVVDVFVEKLKSCLQSARQTDSHDLDVAAAAQSVSVAKYGVE